MVNNVTTTVSYKVHKLVVNPPEEHQIIPNQQEAIISEEDWLRVQELRKNKRRPSKSGKTSMFSGLLYCPDCGSKLHFCTSKTFEPEQDFYRCSKYKSNRGTCSIHFIRNIVLEQIVRTAISDLADFVRCYESVFLYMITEKNELLKAETRKAEQRRLAQAEKRQDELDFLSKRVYEDNAFGKISDERFEKLLLSYESEQKELEKTIADLRNSLSETEKENTELRHLFCQLRKLTQIKELDSTLVNSLIRRIEVHNSEKRDGKMYVKVDIYFTAIGMFDIPSEKEINAVIKRMNKKNKTA